MRDKTKILLVIGMTVFGLTAFSVPGALADPAITVYLEGAYDDTYLDVYIYANITPDAVISYGVRLEYLTNELTFDSAAKNVDPPPYTSNGTLWQLGSLVNKNNPDPVHQIPNPPGTKGIVIFKGGIMDEAGDPTSGIIEKERVFLGTVRFTPTGASFPSNPNLTFTYAEDYSADPDSYKNFVQYNDGAGVVLDSADTTHATTGVEFRAVNYSTVPFDIARRGDANADGVVNALDFGTIRSMYFGGTSKAYADCNADGNIDSLDFGCVINVYFSSNQ